MDTINDGIRFLNRSIDAITDYVKENAIQLFIIGALLYYLKNRKPHDQGYTLSQSRSAVTNDASATTCNDSNNCGNSDCCSSPSSNATTTVRSRDAHLMAVRERQQQLANQRAQEAAKLRKEKQELERERKNNVAKKTTTLKGGDVLGSDSGASSCSYNPLQPFTGHSNGYRYVANTNRKTKGFLEYWLVARNDFLNYSNTMNCSFLRRFAFIDRQDATLEEGDVNPRGCWLGQQPLGYAWFCCQ